MNVPLEEDVDLLFAGVPEPERLVLKQNIKASREEQLLERVNALWKHYAGETEKPKDWTTWLLILLAQDFVPGFTDADAKKLKRKGRKRGSTKDDSAQLLCAVWQFTGSGKTSLFACQQLVKRAGPWRGLKATALKSRYDRAMAGLQTPRHSVDDPFFKLKTRKALVKALVSARK